jgi:hypothetical protein
MQLQAYQLASIKPPSPPTRASLEPVQSSRANISFLPIEMEMLVEIPAEDIVEFRHYLWKIPFLYNDLVPSILGRHLKTKADVRMYFDSSIVLAVWPVALAMVPTVRTADLVLTSEKTYSNAENSSRPDESIIAFDDDVNSPIAQIEYKGPQGLKAFSNVFRAWSEETSIQLPNSWNMVTRQLRKYAEITECRTILCSDGSDAYIFVFPDADEPSEDVHFLHASNDGGALTLREAVLYLVYNGIKLSYSFTLRYGFAIV